MCSVSAVIDTWRENWQPYIQPSPPYTFYPDDAEIQKLKRDVEEFRRILKKAREWDKEHSAEPCKETGDKIEALREIVKALGLEDEVEIVLKELDEDPDDDYYFEPPVTVQINTIESADGTNRLSPAPGGVGGHNDPSAYT